MADTLGELGLFYRLSPMVVMGGTFAAIGGHNPIEAGQLGCAVVVASFLPYTQFRQANIIVDFFTANASQATQTKLDAFGTLLYTIVLGLIAWRVAIGCIDIKSSQETSMLMALPLWIPYMLMVPGLALCSVIGFVQTLQHLGLMTKENV
jgi:TRAP-type C4-dicarboxylate transport system permease small subunit